MNQSIICIPVPNPALMTERKSLNDNGGERRSGQKRMQAAREAQYFNIQRNPKCTMECVETFNLTCSHAHTRC